MAQLVCTLARLERCQVRRLPSRAQTHVATREVVTTLAPIGMFQ